MSNSLTTRAALGLIPLYVGILLRHYYYKLVKGKGKTSIPVPLRSKELMYDEAFSITRVSTVPPFSLNLAVLTKPPELHGHSNEVYPSPSLPHYICSEDWFFSRLWHGVSAIRSKKCRSSRSSICPSLPPHTSCGCRCRFPPAQTLRAH